MVCLVVPSSTAKVCCEKESEPIFIVRGHKQHMERERKVLISLVALLQSEFETNTHLRSPFEWLPKDGGKKCTKYKHSS